MKKYNFNFERIFFIAVIVILAMMLFKACNKKAASGTTVTEYKDRLHTDTVVLQASKDSAVQAAIYWEQKAKQGDRLFAELSDNFNALAAENHEIINQVVPDTCKQYQDAVIAANKKIAIISKQKDEACGRSIQAQRNIVAAKDKIIAVNGQIHARTLKTVDTLSKALAKAQPKGYAFAGLTGLSNYNNFDNAAIGVQLGWTGKNKTTYSAGVFNTKQVIFTVTKKIF